MTQHHSEIPVSNFLRTIIENDLSADRFQGKRWAGVPGPLSIQEHAPKDIARIRTRFPPEPNGYLHIGHAKSIILNFSLAQDYGGLCHLRFDDTNPEKEGQEYVDTIKDSVKWLGFDWASKEKGYCHLYFASDYFDYMYEFAQALIQNGDAYVDEQSPEAIAQMRGNFKEPGKDSPWRNRPIEESLQRFREMREGKHPNGSMALRAKINMQSPNINMRDPVIYRIRHAEHHRMGNTWPIYPMYTYAHPIEDALEGITHSICTLEFEDQRPFYDWLLDKLRHLGFFKDPLPKQYEFARLKMKYIVTSKRKLLKLVQDGLVSGWDDPRMPTLVGLRRRGYTPSALRLFIDRLGVSKADSVIDYSVLEQALRDDLDPIAKRAVAVLDPIKLVITNLPEGHEETCFAPVNPHDPQAGKRAFPFTRELWIERDDFREVPPKKYFRLFPGNTVRLKYAYVVRCTGFVKNEQGEVTEVHAEYLPDTKSGTPGSDSIKVKGNVTWVSTQHAVPATVNLYDRLFTEEFPDSADKDFLASLNPHSLQSIKAWLEPGIDTTPGNQWQFERLGYFVADQDSRTDQPIINRSVTLRDTWV